MTTTNRDYLLHALVGFFIAYLAGAAAPFAGPPAAAVLGKLKEEWDRRHPLTHTADGWDAFATVAGAFPGQAATLAMPPQLLVQLLAAVFQLQ